MAALRAGTHQASIRGSRSRPTLHCGEHSPRLLSELAAQDSNRGHVLVFGCGAQGALRGRVRAHRAFERSLRWWSERRDRYLGGEDRHSFLVGCRAMEGNNSLRSHWTFRPMRAAANDRQDDLAVARSIFPCVCGVAAFRTSLARGSWLTTGWAAFESKCRLSLEHDERRDDQDEDLGCRGERELFDAAAMARRARPRSCVPRRRWRACGRRARA